MDLEPGIAPLVVALNQTGVVQSFSSCEGHFDPHPGLRDRSHAEVRLLPAPGTLPGAVEAWLGTVLTRFKARHGLLPVTVVGYKLFTPLDADTVEETYVLELRPFNRHDPPATRRADIDRATQQLAALV